MRRKPADGRKRRPLCRAVQGAPRGICCVRCVPGLLAYVPRLLPSALCQCSQRRSVSAVQGSRGGQKRPSRGQARAATFREEERATLMAGAFAASVAVLCGVGTHMAHSLTSHSCAVIARAPWLLNSCCAGSARWGVRFRRRRKTRKPSRMIASNADSQSRAGAWYLPTLCTATHARRNTHTHAQKEREGGRERDGEGRREEGEREGGRGGERGRVREKDRET